VPRHKQEWLMIASLVVLDSLCMVGALYLAYWLRMQGSLWQAELPTHMGGAYWLAGGLTLPLWLGLCLLSGLYDPARLLGGVEEYAAVVKANTMGIALLIIVSFMLHLSYTLARGWVILVWVVSIALMGLARFLFRRLVYRLRRRGVYVERAVIAGVSDQAESLAAQLETDGTSGLQVVGFLDDYLPIGTPVGNGLSVLGSPCAVERIAHDLRVSQVIALGDALTWESFQYIISNAGGPRNGYDVKLLPSFYELLTTGVEISHRTSVPLMTFHRARLTGLDAALKAGLDYTVAGALLVLLGPAMGVLALALRLSGSGQVLQRIPVLGQGHAPCNLLKFRSRAGAGAGLERWLYRSRADKLPQLFNVLAGRLSLVGPRPLPVGMEAHYAGWLPGLLSVKPGITGPWATHGRMNASLDAEMYQNMVYIRKWTIWLDLQILYQSIMRHLGEYRTRLVWSEPSIRPFARARTAASLRRGDGRDTPDTPVAAGEPGAVGRRRPEVEPPG